ncbi:MAG: T9SS type A sorting domain-containing protein [Chitinophagales bacterium]|nr:T9SS type A sorting domain-containing protein [Chitinophagales bacterium]
MKKHFLAITLLFVVTCCLGQPITFSRVFSNFPLSPENGIVVKENINSYYLLSGTSCLGNSSYDCTQITKLDSSGNIEWFRQYPFHPGSSSLEVKDNKLFVVGHTNALNPKYVFYCLSDSGDELWIREYGDDAKRNKFPRLLSLGDKWLISGGQSREIGSQLTSILYFVLTDAEGNILNQFYYGAANTWTSSWKLIADQQGNAVVGFIYCPDVCFLNNKGGFIAIDTTGSIVWEQDMPLSYEPFTALPAYFDSSAIALQWYVDNKTIPNHDLTPPAIFFKGVNGAIEDSLIFHNQTLKEIKSMESVLGKGLVGGGSEYVDYLTVGYKYSSGWIFRIDKNRELIWERSFIDTTYNGNTFGLQHIIPTSDGGFIATGTVTNYMTGVLESHNWLLKLDSLGCLEPGCVKNNFIINSETPVFLKGKNIRIFPVPANQLINILLPPDVDLSNLSAVLVSNAGNVVLQKPVHTYTMQVALSELPSGTYFLLLRRGNEIILSKHLMIQH